ncbi:MAG TPA: hypothetical protein VIJ07_09165 [Dermatophilaceae bacterium]
MDSTVIAGVTTAGLSALGLSLRRYFAYLERKQDLQFARHVFDNTLSTQALEGYTELRRAKRPVIFLPNRSKRQNEISEGPPGDP